MQILSISWKASNHAWLHSLFIFPLLLSTTFAIEYLENTHEVIKEERPTFQALPLKLGDTKEFYFHVYTHEVQPPNIPFQINVIITKDFTCLDFKSMTTHIRWHMSLSLDNNLVLKPQLFDLIMDLNTGFQTCHLPSSIYFFFFFSNI